MALSHLAQMTKMDILAIAISFLRGKWSVNSGNMGSRVTWAACDTAGYQVIGIKPIKTAYFFTFDVS